MIENKLTKHNHLSISGPYLKMLEKTEKNKI